MIYDLQDDRIDIRTSVKINLGLDVLYKRDDGFHELRSIFQEVNWGDHIVIRRLHEHKGIRFWANVAHLNNPENLCYKAAEGLLPGLSSGLDIALTKYVPDGTGLGGGSADAAAVLVGINKLCNLGLQQEELARIGAHLGSDVPFFVYGQTAHVGGRGEVITPIVLNAGGYRVLLVVPDIKIPTKTMFERIKNHLTPPEKSSIFSVSFLNPLSVKDLKGLNNDFERIAFHLHPELYEIKNELSRAGCEVVQMSGSGSAIYGLFKGALEVPEKLKKYRHVVTDMIC
jgi:4-diphosphocytidyl-2-C-methyl-D-erythritol kinase